MPDPRQSDRTVVPRPPPAAVSEALACELAMLEATLAPRPAPAAAPRPRAPPEEKPEKFAGR